MLRLHRSFRGRHQRPRCEPPLPIGELLEHPSLSHIVVQLATALDARGHFSEGTEADWYCNLHYLKTLLPLYTTIITLHDSIALLFGIHEVFCVVRLLFLLLDGDHWQNTYRRMPGTDHSVVVTTLRKRPTNLYYSLEFPSFPSALRCLPNRVAPLKDVLGRRRWIY